MSIVNNPPFNGVTLSFDDDPSLLFVLARFLFVGSAPFSCDFI